MVNTYTLTIIDKIEEIPGVVTIRFKQPALKKVKYKPGQYITIIIVINGRKYKRPYSISSVFGIDESINITVKAIPGGVVSNYLVNEVTVGQMIEVIEPMGSYIFPYPGPYNAVYLWSAGSGITPNYAILRNILFNYPDVDNVVLVYSNKNTSNTIFNKELALLSSQFKDRLTIKYIHTWPDELSKHVHYDKRIDGDCIKDILQQIGRSNSASHFICGPQEMKELIVSELQVAGFALGDIYSEDFYNSVDPSMLTDVVDSQIQLQFDGHLYSFTIEKGKSILDACLDKNYDLPYSCQSGTCTLCKAKLLEGRVKRIISQAPDKPLESDEFLTCCSYPLTSSIAISI